MTNINIDELRRHYERLYDGLQARLSAAEAKIEQQQEAWPPLRAVLEKYIYDVGGKPNVVKAAVLEYEQAVAKAEEEQSNGGSVGF